jgi:hypothetical protein
MLQRPARTLAHAVIILLIAQALAPLLGGRPLPALLIQYARPAMFVPWSVGLAGGLNADRIIIITLGVIIVLTTWPDNMLPYAIASILGIVLGGSIRGLIIREHHNNG